MLFRSMWSKRWIFIIETSVASTTLTELADVAARRQGTLCYPATGLARTRPFCNRAAVDMASFYEQPCKGSEDSTEAWIIFLNDST